VSFCLSITSSKGLKSREGGLKFLDTLEKYKISNFLYSIIRLNYLKREEIIL